MAQIRVLFGDGGGRNNLLPVVEKLSEEHEIQIALTGASVSWDGSLNSKFRGVVRPSSADELTDFFKERHDLTLVASSQSEQSAQFAARAISSSGAQRNCVLVEDMYGSSLQTLKLVRFANTAANVRAICVIDQLAKKHISRNSSPNNYWSRVIRVTGGPQFDWIADAKENFAEDRRRLREELFISDNYMLFLFAGGKNGIDDMLTLLKSALHITGSDVMSRIILKNHPTRQSWQDDMVMRDVCQNMWPGMFIDYNGAIEDVLPAADFLLTPYSTVGHTAALLEMPGVIYVGSPAIHWDLWQEKKLMRPPEVEAGAARYIDMPAEPNPDRPRNEAVLELIGIIQKFYSGKEKNPELQEQISAKQAELAESAQLGKATDNVVNVIQELLE